MSNINDSKILELKKQIEEKKTKLNNQSSKFIPNTNCVIDLDGTKINLNTLRKEGLIELLIKLNLIRMSAEDLNLENYCISGYSLLDWIGDIKGKIEVISRKDEEAKLKAMEQKLYKLLSEDKKVELELNEIENLLS